MKQLLPNQVSSSTEISPSNAIFSKLMDDLSGKIPEQKKLLIQEALNNIQLQGFNLNALSYMGGPLLLAAIAYDEQELFESLIVRGIDVNDEYRYRLIDRKFSYVLQSLLKKSKYLDSRAQNSPNLSEQNALSLAIILNDVKKIKLLLQHWDIDVNRNAGQYPPLFFAISYNRLEILKLLFEHRDIDVNKLCECKDDGQDVINLLLEMPANDNLDALRYIRDIVQNFCNRLKGKDVVGVEGKFISKAKTMLYETKERIELYEQKLKVDNLLLVEPNDFNLAELRAIENNMQKLYQCLKRRADLVESEFISNTKTMLDETKEKINLYEQKLVDTEKDVDNDYDYNQINSFSGLSSKRIKENEDQDYPPYKRLRAQDQEMKENCDTTEDPQVNEKDTQMLGFDALGEQDIS